MFCLYCFFSGAFLSAQQEASQSYPLIDSIRLEFDGFQSVSDEYVFNHIQLREGMNYNPALVDQSIRSLYNTNYFEYVELVVDDAQDGAIHVVVKLIPKYTISKIVITETRLTRISAWLKKESSKWAVLWMSMR